MTNYSFNMTIAHIFQKIHCVDWEVKVILVIIIINMYYYTYIVIMTIKTYAMILVA